MGAAVFTSGPDMEMAIAIAARTPMTPAVEDSIVTWRVPLDDGAVLHVALDDCGYYARWLFDNRSSTTSSPRLIASWHTLNGSTAKPVPPISANSHSLLSGEFLARMVAWKGETDRSRMGIGMA